MAQILAAIKTAIRDSGLTQYRIEQDTGIPASAISRLLSGERGLSVENVERLADYLGLVIDIHPAGKPGSKRTRKGR
ncbi:MAG: XRE family transcriptional regulator [Planctomycetes bacterium]|nr:XRE family transcriptional regulator [Planctomycetota bacterium]NOG54739.1 helix-turn-helix transcriptional regulator [Planctomycetota bacterium]